jgi:hypothetical protein
MQPAQVRRAGHQHTYKWIAALGATRGDGYTGEGDGQS